MSSRLLKLSGLSGIVAPFLAFGFILAAILSWQPFSWTNNALSDLGVQSGITAIVFNSGLIISGLLFLIFGLGLFRFSGKHLLGKVGAVIFILACVSLIAIGVFNESFKPTHYMVSVAFFVLLPISLLVLVGAFWVSGKHKLSALTVIVALVAISVWAFEFAVDYVPNVAIPEFISGFAGAVWAIVLGYLMLGESAKS